MKAILLALVISLLVVTDVLSGTARVVKVETGTCSGSNSTFKKKEWVDLSGDGKADWIVTTWCNNKVSVTEASIISGDWPSNWTSTLDYHTEAANGTHDFRFTYRDVVNNTALGTETTDSMSPRTASLVFYTYIMAKPIVTDPLNQEPAGSVETSTKVEVLPIIAKLSFESYDAGNHIVVVTIRDVNNGDQRISLSVNVGGAGKVSIPYIVPEGAKVIGFTVSRPGDRIQSDFFGND